MLDEEQRKHPEEVKKMLFLIGISLFLLLVIPNFDSILTSLGYETRTSLRGKLSTEIAKTEQLVLANKELTASIELEKSLRLTAESNLKEFKDTQSKIEDKVVRIKSFKTKEKTGVIVKINKETVVTPTTITVNKVDADAISRANIEQLHLVYQVLAKSPVL